MSKRDDLEHRALQAIANKGSEGILQCDLWRELDASGREGSRISLKLENKNLIKRDKELFDGRWTYRLFIRKCPVKIDSILEIPCVSCSVISKCEMDSDISPNICDEMTRWLLTSSKGKPMGEKLVF